MVLQEVRAGLETVRPGRKLFVRQVCLRQRADDDSDSTSGAAAAAALRIVFVHGTCATERQFQLLLDAMDRQICARNAGTEKDLSTLTSIHCLLYDLVGCGQSPPFIDIPGNQWDAYATEESMADMLALLEKYCVGDDKKLPTILLGHSYGPNLFLRLLEKHTRLPTLIDLQGIILMSTAVRCPHLTQPDGGHVIMRLPIVVLNCLKSFLTEAFIRMAVHPSHGELQQAVRQDSNSNSMQVAKAYHRHMIWAPTSVLQTTFMKQAPVLIVHGVDDGIISVQCAHYLANQLPQSQFVSVDHASHLIMMEEPERAASSVLEFLERIMTDMN